MFMYSIMIFKLVNIFIVLTTNNDQSAKRLSQFKLIHVRYLTRDITQLFEMISVCATETDTVLSITNCFC